MQELWRSKANNINFHYRTKSVKINEQIFLWIQKPYFWPIFQTVGANKVFSKNSSSVTHNFIRVSSTMQKLREIWWSNFKKTSGQTTGWKDKQTLFHRILPATDQVLLSTMAVHCHLKVKDIEYNVGLTKIIASQSACEKWALGPHELNGHAHF